MKFARSIFTISTFRILAVLGLCNQSCLFSIAQASQALHPQPQFERSDWLDLNGSWNFSFDDKNVGLIQNWQTLGLPLSRAIQVPFPFESALSGIQDTSEHPFSWYEKSFPLPAQWREKTVVLHFGAVFYRATVWLNGKQLGTHTGGQTPFEFILYPSLLEKQPGQKNHLVIRCEHPPEDPSIARGKQTISESSTGIYYTRSSGIWQSVWLEPVGENFMDAVHFTTELTGKVSAAISLHQPAHELTTTLRVLGPSRQIWDFSRTIAEGETQSLISFQIPNPELWAPGQGKLYHAEIKLLSQGKSTKDGGPITLDDVKSYFGIREVRVSEHHVQINGANTYLKFVLDQGFWPDGIWSAPNLDAFESDIQTTLSLGFNGVRKHQKLEDPRYLYLADQYGLMVSSEFGSPRTFTEASHQQFSKEFLEAVMRDWNHPSIILWVPANESWGYPDLSQSDQQSALLQIYDLVKQLDPTRLVIDNDGWQHTSQTDLFAIHDYAKEGAELRRQFLAFNPLVSPPITLPGVAPSMIPGYLYNGSPVYLSEFGGVGYLHPGDTVPSNAWGYSGLEADQAHATARLANIYSGLTGPSPIEGICLTQLTDVEQELNGLMTYHRVLKYDPREIKRLNDSLQLENTREF